MKHILLIMTIASIAMFGSCTGGRTSAHSHADHSEHAADHDHNHGAAGHNHDHDHDHEHGHAHGHDAHSESGSSPEEIVFSAEQAARSGIKIGEVKRGKFSEVLKCSGTVSVSPSGVAVMSAPIEGIVTFADSGISQDIQVKKGQLLFNISAGQLASGDAVERIRIEYRLAQENFQRIEALYKDKLVTKEAYLAAEAEYLKAKNQYEPIMNGGKNGLGVKASANGYLSQLFVQAGDFVEVGQPLASIATSNRMQLRAMVSQRYLDRLYNISGASFRPSGADRYISLADLNGKLISVGRRVEQGSLMIPVVFEFDGGGMFPDGMYVDVVLSGADRDDIVTVPLSALTEQQGLFYVYQQIDEDCYRRVQVWTGADNGTDIEIVKGLEGGEPIVVSGAVNVKMAAASGAIPHGHTH